MVSTPRLVVGLGNPGAEYAATRHNAGFRFVERLADSLGCALKREPRFHGMVARARAPDLWLLQPQTFMNRSGIAVLSMAQFYRVEPAQILVVHDELDLPPGYLRLKFGGGLGGHNGLKDVVPHLGTQDFWRLRIGIGHPGDRSEVVNYVLQPARRQEQEGIDAALDRALQAWPLIARGEWNAAMQKLNARALPDAPAEPKVQDSP